MKREYSFRHGERGKFYFPKAILEVPIYLDETVQTYLSKKADNKGVPLNALVNVLLKREIEIMESTAKKS